MSDFTRTTNYALYKPTPNSDDDTWGDHLNANADILESALSGALSFNPLPPNAANDAAAATAGVLVGGVYRNGSMLMVRVA